MERILLVDDDPGVLDLVGAVLKSNGYEVVTTLDGEEARDMINSDEHFDLMLSDIDMSPLNGIELLRYVCLERPEMSVVMLTGNASLETATEAMKLGAYDYILKPLDPDEFLATVARALEHDKSFEDKTDLKIELGKKYFLENVIAESDQMRNVCEMIQKVALVDTPVPIYGESGTGKTLVAKSIHAHSNRKEEPFLAIDCATLPVPLLELVLFGHVRGAPLTGDAPPKPGLFESAKDGTVLLEQIDSLPLSLQERLFVLIKTKKLQRVGSTDVIEANPRILVTSNQSPDELKNAGLLDNDLYSLLKMIPIQIDQIRERPQDIIPLAYHILQTETGKDEEELPALSSEVREMLESYSWPGNVGELVHAIRYAISCATDNKITKDFLPSKITAAYSPKPKTKADEVDDLRGKSLKAFISSKKDEYLDKLRPTKKAETGTYESGAKRSRFGPKIRLTSEPEAEGEEPKKNGPEVKWQG